LQTEEDLQKIIIPQVFYDEKTTKNNLEKAHELLDVILDIRLQGYLPNIHSWDLISTWKGVENALYDLADRPESFMPL